MDLGPGGKRGHSRCARVMPGQGQLALLLSYKVAGRVGIVRQGEQVVPDKVTKGGHIAQGHGIIREKAYQGSRFGMLQCKTEFHQGLWAGEPAAVELKYWLGEVSLLTHDYDPAAL